MSKRRKIRRTNMGGRDRRESPRQRKDPVSLRWRSLVGVAFTGLSLVLGAVAGLGVPILPCLVVVFYGLLAKDLKLAALFGVVFVFAFFFGIAARDHAVPPPSAIPPILLYSVLNALLGVISALIGRRVPME